MASFTCPTHKPKTEPEKPWLIVGNERHYLACRRLLERNNYSRVFTSHYDDKGRSTRTQTSYNPFLNLGINIEKVKHTPFIKFLLQIKADKWCIREQQLYKTIDNYNQLTEITFRKNPNKQRQQIARETIQAEISQWLDDTAFRGHNESRDMLYINKIIRALHKLRHYLNIEEKTEMPNCYITGAPLTPKYTTKTKILKIWGQKTYAKNCNISQDATFQLIPIYEHNPESTEPPINLETGESNTQPTQHSTFEFLNEIIQQEGSLNRLSLSIIHINNGITQRYVGVMGEAFNPNNYFLQQTRGPLNTNYYVSGQIKPLPYSTHPTYLSSDTPTLPSQAHYGLEIEIDDKYTTTNAIKYNGKLLTPLEVLKRYNWVISSDSSIGGFELKSPVLRNSAQWQEQIPTPIAQLINQCSKDKRCGTHIHLSTYDTIATFCFYQHWAWLFALIYPMRIANPYCKIHNKNWGQDQRDKYQWLRLRTHTIEFRFFPRAQSVNVICWRLTLLNILFRIYRSIKTQPKTPQDTIEIFKSDTKETIALKEHVFKRKPPTELLEILHDELVAQCLETRGHFANPITHKFTQHLLLNKEAYTKLESYLQNQTTTTH